MEMDIESRNMNNKASITNLEVFVPNNKIDNQFILSRINYNSNLLKNGSLERLMGVRDRYFAPDDIQVSDLACEAAKKILIKRTDLKVDLLIFAAASSDLIEPATANIIQSKLGLDCPVMDIKNACNSFVTAIQVASSFVNSGMYDKVLIVNGEKLSEVINFNPINDDHLIKCLSSYSLGDAGAAMLVENSESDSGKILFQNFFSSGQYWDVSTVYGGGSLAYRDIERFYFESDSVKLASVFTELIPSFMERCFNEASINHYDIDCLITHQVSDNTVSKIANRIGIPIEKSINSFPLFGNTAAATIPLAINYAIETNKLKSGDLLCILGLAAGISLSFQLIQW